MTTISAAQLRDLVEGDESFALVDTRPADSFEGWRVEGAINFPFSTRDELDPEAFADRTGIGRDETIVAICAKGISSHTFAEQLDAAGYEDVQNVQGGMETWSRLYEVVQLPTRHPEIEIIQIQRRAKGCLGYVVGCAVTGSAAVVDATRHTDEFIDAATDAGFEVTHVFDTHVHADHISGGRTLAAEVGATYFLGERATDREVEYDYEPLARNEVVHVGEVPIKAIETPGHTTEMVSYLVADEALLTGDTLFVDSVGRTELQFGDGNAQDGARMLYRSLHHTILAEPDSITVLPGHFAVDNDGTSSETPGEPVTATVGDLRTGLQLLELDAESFVETLTDRLPEKPPNYETVIEINTGRETGVDDQQATELELGPNRCAAAGD